MKISIYDKTLYTKVLEKYLNYFIDLLTLSDIDYPLLLVNVKNDVLLDKYKIEKHKQFYVFKDLFLNLNIITLSDENYSIHEKVARKYKINLCNLCNLLNEIYLQSEHKIHFPFTNVSKIVKMKNAPLTARMFLYNYQIKNISFYADK